MKPTRLLAIAFSLLTWISAGPLFAEQATVFVVHEYSFDNKPGEVPPENAQTLCGTRCNALSGSFNSYMMPGGWRLVKTEVNKKLEVDIATPFIDGKCICRGDEYTVSRDIPLPPVYAPTQIKTE